MNAPAPTLGTLHREKSREFTHALVMVWLVYLNDLLDLRKHMSEDQIELCATEIVNEFYSLKMSDLAFPVPPDNFGAVWRILREPYDI
ncbi:hypothetical protein R1T16_14090 [Flavobacterium sp. DG1-102-2]|uniref:hypothetical protein n=1 Tax=Flavobacterium sp. DG1-102-2 TaxID=3081663 RepID=UPI0029495268|nr:hypothetical protein [Flavobacterium sp. DG1-102-2]MDV6169562.1 hypothetical protein [Flavobacterium sp. DG1-102-2]